MEPTLKVVALATGTKCIGQSEMSPKGSLLHSYYFNKIVKSHV